MLLILMNKMSNYYFLSFVKYAPHEMFQTDVQILISSIKLLHLSDMEIRTPAFPLLFFCWMNVNCYLLHMKQALAY
jgi:hypothetical protein